MPSKRSGKKVKTVLMTADTLGGVWGYALELARALDQYGIHVVLATMGNPLNENRRREIDALNNVTIQESNFRLEWMKNPWVDVDMAGKWLQELTCIYKPDIIHLNDFSHGTCMWRRPSLVVAHSCVYSWFSHVKKETPPSTEWKEYKKRVTAGMRGADLIITPSHAMAADIRKHYAVNKPVRVLYNGRRPVDFIPRQKEPFVFAAGRIWDEGKNLCGLADCAPHLLWPVYIAGESKHPDGKNTALEHVHMLGSLTGDTMCEWFARASIYAHPARYEPFGLSVLEAALSGCALVLGDIPSLREIWGDTAQYVSPDDSNALCRSIQNLIENPALRTTLSTKSRTRALRLNTHRMAEEYLRLYENLFISTFNKHAVMVG
ncbi:MAG: glycosyltransferase family 4 protein [Chitinivibrionales bacterium]